MMATKKQVSTTGRATQVAQVVALLRQALNGDADSLTLWRIADKVAMALKALPQSDEVVSAHFWALAAMQAADDCLVSNARLYLERALEALTK